MSQIASQSQFLAPLFLVTLGTFSLKLKYKLQSNIVRREHPLKLEFKLEVVGEDVNIH